MNGSSNKNLGPRGRLEKQGLLADANVQGHLKYLRRLLEELDLLAILQRLGLQLVTFSDLGLPGELEDRTLWNLCQRDGWVLFTDNRNNESADSLEATIRDSWKVNDLPVLTVSDKNRFENDRVYGERVAADVADILFGILEQEFLDQPRIFIPRRWF